MNINWANVFDWTMLLKCFVTRWNNMYNRSNSYR